MNSVLSAIAGLVNSDAGAALIAAGLLGGVICAALRRGFCAALLAGISFALYYIGSNYHIVTYGDIGP